HTDASQSFGKMPIDVQKMNIDVLTASSHKVYGPKGAALLFIRSGVNIEPLLHGGGHERGMRSSTVNVPAVVGFARAVDICLSEMGTEMNRQRSIKNRIIKRVLEEIPNSYLNGHPEKSLPNIMNIRFDFVEGESVLALLDLEGVAVSTASACSSPKLEPSHVLMACGLKAHEAHGAIRMSIGRFTTDDEVDYAVDALVRVIKRLREISPFKVKEDVQ
ncbi:cysteine desulfurase NifS, partial [Candidatus Heimdallarchaeota archaeon]